MAKTISTQPPPTAIWISWLCSITTTGLSVLTMSVKKTCIMPVRQMDEDASRRLIKGKEVPPPSFNINIRSEHIQTVDEFCYLTYYFTRDFSNIREIDARLAKASTAFSMLRHVIWYRKTVSISARLSIFRSCVLPVLLYGSEVWSLTTALERRLCTFYHRCLRTIIDVNLGDRMSNDHRRPRSSRHQELVTTDNGSRQLAGVN